MEFTISKSKVGPVTARYIDGEYQNVDRGGDGRKKQAILGLDNSHSKDYKVAYASDPLITVKAGKGITHDELQSALEELGIWELANWAEIEVPHGESWRAGFKTLPEDVSFINRMYEKCERELSDHELLGDAESFSVYI